MKRTFEVETSELDEKALLHAHMADRIDFAFKSILSSVVNSSRDQLVRSEREQAAREGRLLIGDDDAIILAATSLNADARHAQMLARLDEERADRERNAALTARQLRLGLVGNGFSLAQVDAAIDALPDGAEKEMARIEWQYAGEFKRDHPLLMTIAAQLGISAEQFDAMWVAAQKL